MQTKTFFARTLAAIATAVAVVTAPVATTTMSATVVTPAVASVTAVALVLAPTSAQAGRRDPRYDTIWDQFRAWISGIVLSE